MSIEVRVPEEIADYKESIVAGLSIRQLVCSGIALMCGVPTFFIFKNINMDFATYATMAVVVPAFCVGFIKKGGYNFETYAKIRLTSFLSRSKRGYETNPDENSLPIETEKYRAEIQQQIKEELQKQNTENTVKKRGVNIDFFRQKAKSKGSFKRTAKAEYDLAEISKKGAERKRKSTYKELKAAAGNHGAKKRKEKKAD